MIRFVGDFNETRIRSGTVYKSTDSDDTSIRSTETDEIFVFRLAKAEADKTFDEDLKVMINLIDSAVRSMDIEKMQRAVGIYEKYFLGVEVKKKAGFF